MKTKTRNILCILAVSAAFLSLVSCHKTVPEGQMITADGTVTDFATQAPFPGVKVYLFGGKFVFGHGIQYGYGPYDSAVTDAEGHFAFRYRAEGMSDDYDISLIDYMRDNSNSFLPYNLADSNTVLFNKARNLPGIRFSVYKTSGLKLHLTIDNLVQDSMFVSIYSESAFSIYYYLLRGHSIDTVLSARYVPGRPEYAWYSPYSTLAEDTLINGIYHHRELTDTLQISTTGGDAQVDRHFSSAADFPWHP